MFVSTITYTRSHVYKYNSMKWKVLLSASRVTVWNTWTFYLLKIGKPTALTREGKKIVLYTKHHISITYKCKCHDFHCNIQYIGAYQTGSLISFIYGVYKTQSREEKKNSLLTFHGCCIFLCVCIFVAIAYNNISWLIILFHCICNVFSLQLNSV